MQDVKISERDLITTLDGTEIIPFIQGGADKKGPVSAIVTLVGGGGGGGGTSTFNLLQPQGTDNTTTALAALGFNMVADGTCADFNNAAKLPVAVPGDTVTIINGRFNSTLTVYTNNPIGSFHFLDNLSSAFGVPPSDYAITFRCVANTVDGDIWNLESASTIANPDAALTANSEVMPPSQSAVKIYVENNATLRRKVSITSLNILALNTNPVTLIPAPGNNKIIQPISYLIRFYYGTTDYTGTNLNLKVGTFPALSIAGVINSTQDSIFMGRVASGSVVGADTVSNAAMTISADANPTTGDSTMEIYITYSIITL